MRNALHPGLKLRTLFISMHISSHLSAIVSLATANTAMVVNLNVFMIAVVVSMATKAISVLSL